MRGLLERGRRRTRQDQISLWSFRPGETADPLEEIRTERRKPISSAGSVLERASSFPKCDPAV